MNLYWNYGEKGAKLSAGLAVVGTFLTKVLGGWDVMVRALIVFMVVDFALGFLCSVKCNTTNSRTMFWGGVNKILVLLFVALGVVLDDLLGMPSPAIRTAVIWFYVGREGLSIVENYGKMGLPLPAFIKSTLEQLKNSGDNPA